MTDLLTNISEQVVRPASPMQSHRPVSKLTNSSKAALSPSSPRSIFEICSVILENDREYPEPTPLFARLALDRSDIDSVHSDDWSVESCDDISIQGDCFFEKATDADELIDDEPMDDEPLHIFENQEGAEDDFVAGYIDSPDDYVIQRVKLLYSCCSDSFDRMEIASPPETSSHRGAKTEAVHSRPCSSFNVDCERQRGRQAFELKENELMPVLLRLIWPTKMMVPLQWRRYRMDPWRNPRHRRGSSSETEDNGHVQEQLQRLWEAAGGEPTRPLGVAAEVEGRPVQQQPTTDSTEEDKKQAAVEHPAHNHEDPYPNPGFSMSASEDEAELPADYPPGEFPSSEDTMQHFGQLAGYGGWTPLYDQIMQESEVATAGQAAMPHPEHVIQEPEAPEAGLEVPPTGFIYYGFDDTFLRLPSGIPPSHPGQYYPSESPFHGPVQAHHWPPPYRGAASLPTSASVMTSPLRPASFRSATASAREDTQVEEDPRSTSRQRRATRSATRAGHSYQRSGEATEQIRRGPSAEELARAGTRRGRAAVETWWQRWNELYDYRSEHGDCNVPQKYTPNPQLGIWVNKQRMEKKDMDDGRKSSMTDQRVRALDSLGFMWAKRKGQHSWEEKFQQLIRFKHNEGHCNVPTKYQRNQALGRWVSTQRSQYKQFTKGVATHMTEERVRRLLNIGFQFDMTQVSKRNEGEDDNDEADDEEEEEEEKHREEKEDDNDDEEEESKDDLEVTQRGAV